MCFGVGAGAGSGGGWELELELGFTGPTGSGSADLMTRPTGSGSATCLSMALVTHAVRSCFDASCWFEFDHGVFCFALL